MTRHRGPPPRKQPTAAQQAEALHAEWGSRFRGIVAAHPQDDEVFSYIRLELGTGNTHLWAAPSKGYRNDVLKALWKKQSQEAM